MAKLFLNEDIKGTGKVWSAKNGATIGTRVEIFANSGKDGYREFLEKMGWDNDGEIQIIE